ncbi:MAG: phosphoglycerate kinase [Actinomycetota bacterium]
MRIRTLGDLGDVRGLRVLVRADLNVPLADGDVADDFRIAATLPTLRELLDAGCALVVASHLGRPKGAPRSDLSLAPVARRLAALLGRGVRLATDVVGPDARAACAALRPGEVVLLENLRFEPGEEANDPAFADALAALADRYVDDAFGAAHRAHASVAAVASRLPSAGGRLLEREVAALSRLLDSPARPYVAVLGGAKVSDKLATLGALAERVDALLIGGTMAFTPIAAGGGRVGVSLVEPERGPEALAVLDAAAARGVEVLLPSDVVAASEIAPDAPTRVVPADDIPADLRGLDIGPRTVDAFARTIASAATVLWNGPMGVFEWPAFAAGTEGVARAIAASPAFSVVGGGDSLLAVRRLGLEGAFGHLSTGGGASLEFLEGRDLPGLRALEVA